MQWSILDDEDLSSPVPSPQPAPDTYMEIDEDLAPGGSEEMDVDQDGGDDVHQQTANRIVPRQDSRSDGGLRAVSCPRQVLSETDSLPLLPPASSVTRTTIFNPVVERGEDSWYLLLDHCKVRKDMNLFLVAH
ncbi:uncharacterized protein PHALS_03521 [Plasmopara halstedii]|uniref:Uncharacterized protein n=1 Tax=Plasmopara halstedii TaxID=4781 RepID=A0A0P1AYB3_PLAHL|nr:uncharacterized protein PHALS_03521 [Plasmopara halstedii]CEG46844.1 hypothetical protein PHALS_03521 [Plasmopara halstedii]|eukprot:XP_024583213.1 hypothetical protein PHALS_03521 [Plasmopara halstedii]